MSCLHAQTSSFGIVQASPPPTLASTLVADWVNLLTWVKVSQSNHWINCVFRPFSPSLNHWAWPLCGTPRAPSPIFEGDPVEHKQPQFSVLTSYFLINPFFLECRFIKSYLEGISAFILTM